MTRRNFVQTMAAFDLTLRPTLAALKADARAVLAAGGSTLFDMGVNGTFEVLDRFVAAGTFAKGLAGQITVSLPPVPAAFGFTLTGQATLEVNTTGVAVHTVAGLPVDLPAGTYARVHVAGQPGVGDGKAHLTAKDLDLAGTFDLSAGSDGVAIQADGHLILAPGGTTLFDVGVSGKLAAVQSPATGLSPRGSPARLPSRSRRSPPMAPR